MHKHKILFLTELDPLDKRSWSGIFYQMHNQLSKYFEVVNTGPLPPIKGFWSLAFKMFNKINYKFFKKHYDLEHSKLVGKLYIKKIKKQVYGDFDFIFAPLGYREVSQLNNLKTPIIYTSDITYDLLIKEKYGFAELFFKRSLKEGNEVEQLAIKNATYLLYCSDWAAKSAINTYNANPNKVFVIPFGANINKLPYYNLEEKSSFETLEILFLGVNWVRKGGDLVLKTYELLKAKGVNVHLTICGCVPPMDLGATDITIIPFLNKNETNDVTAFNKLLAQTQILFVPSQAEAYGIVFCEAAANGIPIVSRDTGGISTIVKNGINGYCLSKEATEEDYFQTITNIMSNKKLFETLSQNGRNLYLETFNWDVWGKSVSDLIFSHLSKSNQIS